MTKSATNHQEQPRSYETVMKRVGAASRHFELDSLKFVDCSCSYGSKQEGTSGDVRIGIREQEVTLEEDALQVTMLFEFLAPSPFKDDPIDREKRVAIRARLALEYTLQRDRGALSREDAEVFGRVNGIYNAWPYLREYVQSCLVRLGLPAFELPLLRAGAAAHMAGLVDQSDKILGDKSASP